MYRKPYVNQMAFEDFVLPFGAKLRSDTRWVIPANQIPWAVVEMTYAQQFSKADMDFPEKSSRLALGVPFHHSLLTTFRKRFTHDSLGTIKEAMAEQIRHDRQQTYDDAIARIAIEGKFGQGKRRFGLGRLIAKLALTSETMTQISFLMMNVEHLLSRAIGDWLFSWCQGWSFSSKDLLMTQGNTRHADFRDGNGDVVECRGARMVLLTA